MKPFFKLLIALLLVTGGGVLAQPGATAARYDRAMAELSAAKDIYSRWCALNAAAKESCNQGHDADAQGLAQELEQLAPHYVRDWNYGNAVQDFNLVLGRLALRAGDVETAKRRLLAAGASPGSPQLNSFGPNMSLARDLLDHDGAATVLEYFELCRKFWKLERGRLDAWKKDVEEGRKPEFGANLLY